MPTPPGGLYKSVQVPEWCFWVFRSECEPSDTDFLRKTIKNLWKFSKFPSNPFKSIQIDRNPCQNRDFARKSRFFKFWSSLARSRPTRHSGSVPNVSAMFRECFRSEITRRGGRDNKNIGGGPRRDAYRKSTKMHRLRSGRSSLLGQILPSPSIGIRLKKNKNIFCLTKKNVRTPIYQYKLLIKQSGAGYQPVKSISKMYENFPDFFFGPGFSPSWRGG